MILAAGLKFTVANMWCGEDAHPEVVIDVE